MFYQLNWMEMHGYLYDWVMENSRKIYKASEFNLWNNHIYLFFP